MHYATVTCHDPQCKLRSQFNLPAVVGDKHRRVILVRSPTKKAGGDVCNKVEDSTFVTGAVSTPYQGRVSSEVRERFEEMEKTASTSAPSALLSPMHRLDIICHLGNPCNPILSRLLLLLHLDGLDLPEKSRSPNPCRAFAHLSSILQTDKNVDESEALIRKATESDVHKCILAFGRIEEDTC